EETLGDRIRVALGDNADVIESLEILSRTPHEGLPEAARSRLGTLEGQVNLLIRIMLRPIDRTLTSEEANVIRNVIYEAVHEGPVTELICARWQQPCPRLRMPTLPSHPQAAAA